MNIKNKTKELLNKQIEEEKTKPQDEDSESDRGSSLVPAEQKHKAIIPKDLKQEQDRQRQMSIISFQQHTLFESKKDKQTDSFDNSHEASKDKFIGHPNSSFKGKSDNEV